MQLTQRTDRVHHLFATFAATVFWLLSVEQALEVDPYPPLMLPVGIAVSALFVAWCWLEVFRIPRRRRAVQGFCLLSLAIVIAHVPLLPSFGTDVLPPLLHVTIGGMGCASIAFGTRVGTVVSVAYGVFFGAIRWTSLGWRDGVADLAGWLAEERGLPLSAASPKLRVHA